MHLFKEFNFIKTAIDRLQAFEKEAIGMNSNGYYLAFSGGKDSVCIERLARMAEVKFTPHYNVTTCDPPELMAFIKKNYPEVEFSIPQFSMWDLIPQKIFPPTRTGKYCCEALKHRNGKGRFVITGIRAPESVRRMNKRKIVEYCHPQNKRVLNPIIDWTDFEVWEFIRNESIPYCELYDQGFDRLGCVGCPEQGPAGQLRDFRRWPTIRAKWIKAFEDMIAERDRRNKVTTWRNGEEVMAWWLSMSCGGIDGPMADAIENNK